jgi:hypothetical protein
MFNRLFNRVQVFIISFMIVAYVVLNYDRLATGVALVGFAAGTVVLGITILKRDWHVGD